MDLFEGLGLKGLDWGTYSTFQFLVKHNRALSPVMEAGNWLGSYPAVLIILAITIVALLQSAQRRTVLWVLGAFVLGVVVVEGVKLATNVPRPEDAKNYLAAAALSPSFPSRAVFLAAFAWLMLAMTLERWTQRTGYRLAVYAAAALSIVFVCVSELWLGLHFVTDVLAGLSGGIGLALLARWPGGSRLAVGKGGNQT